MREEEQQNAISKVRRCKPIILAPFLQLLNQGQKFAVDLLFNESLTEPTSLEAAEVPLNSGGV
jgi:hypothetical protein